MSMHRENVTWQSADGTWNRGFYATYVYGDDTEWDVTYYYDEFEWVSAGHASYEAANNSWTGANPGILTRCDYKNNAEECKALDLMAEACKKSQTRRNWTY